MTKKVELFHVGPQKSGTTWFYSCLAEHPEIACSEKDSIHYFDMYYHKGERWYLDHFRAAKEGQLLFDPTYTYLRSPQAPERIASHNEEAKIIITLRNPIDRAFSHYWHEKKKGKYNFAFSEVFSNYDLFSSWIEPGFYALHIKRFAEYFPRHRILFLLFDELVENPERLLEKALEFIGVRHKFKPSVLNKKINQAGTKKNIVFKLLNLVSKYAGEINPAFRKISDIGRAEYVKGISPETRAMLYEMFEADIAETERIARLDLTSWKI